MLGLFLQEMDQEELHLSVWYFIGYYDGFLITRWLLVTYWKLGWGCVTVFKFNFNLFNWIKCITCYFYNLIYWRDDITYIVVTGSSRRTGRRLSRRSVKGRVLRHMWRSTLPFTLCGVVNPLSKSELLRDEDDKTNSMHLMVYNW